MRGGPRKIEVKFLPRVTKNYEIVGKIIDFFEKKSSDFRKSNYF